MTAERILSFTNVVSISWQAAKDKMATSIINVNFFI
jgi:hypothetical protein